MTSMDQNHPSYGRVFRNTPAPGEHVGIDPNLAVHAAYYRHAQKVAETSDNPPDWVADLKRISPAELALMLEDEAFSKKCQGYRP